MPQRMQWIGHLLPPSYVFEAVRAVLAGRPVALSSQLAAVGSALAYMLLGAWTFSLVYRGAVRRGSLARYSAESVA